MNLTRTAFFAALIAAPAFAQILVDPAKLPDDLRNFERKKDEPSVRCEVTPVRPSLNYGFRFTAGYVANIPLSQYTGAGHRLGMVTRITPLGGDRKPVYLMNIVRLPNIPPSKLQLEVGGGYLLGQGKYKVEWTLFDETMRVCRKEWRIDAALKLSERKVRIAMPPYVVADYSLRGAPGARHDTDDVPPVRLTVLLHAAPLSSRRTTMRASDKMMLLGTLSSLLERVPTRSLRLVVFNLDQQKEIFRRDSFSAQSLDQVTESLNELELGAVDYGVLKNRRGHVDLLADLMNQELEAEEPSDEVVFLGPPARFSDKLPQAAVEKPRGSGPRFFYLQLQPFFRAMSGNFPDSINFAVGKVKGKTLVIHTPGEFSSAIDQIEKAGVAGR